MFDAYKRFFRFSGAEKGTLYKGMAFELLRSIFEALQLSLIHISSVFGCCFNQRVSAHLDLKGGVP